MKYLLLCWLSLLVLQFNAQQKKRIDVDAYRRWTAITNTNISTKGNLLTYRLSNYRNNDTLIIFDNSKLRNIGKIGRASHAFISYDERFVVFKIHNDYDSIRQEKLDNVAKDKTVKDSLGILLLQQDTIIKIPSIDQFHVGEKGNDWILVTRNKTFKKETVKSEKKKWFRLPKFLTKKKKEATKVKYKGTFLTVVNTHNWTQQNIEGVTKSTVSYDGEKYAYIQSTTHNDSIDSARLYIYNNDKLQLIKKVAGELLNPVFDRKGNQLTFALSVDTGDYKVHQLYLYEIQNKQLTLVVDTISNAFRDDQSIHTKGRINFSRDGSKLYYEIGIKPTKPPKDTLTKEEKYNLDLWSWTDARLQPQQLLSAKKDKIAAIPYVFHIAENKHIQITDTSLQSISYYNHKNSDYALIRDQVPYLKEMTWDFWYYDYYRVNLKTGEKKSLLKHYQGWSAYLSPDGENFCYFETKDSSWYNLNVQTNKTYPLTKGVQDDFYEEFHDVPLNAGSAGSIRWVKGGKEVLIQSQRNMWLVHLDGTIAENITVGSQPNQRFSYLKLDIEEVYVDLQKGLHLKSFNKKTKAEHLYYYSNSKKNSSLSELIKLNAKIIRIKKAKESDQIILQQMTFVKSPEVFLTDTSFLDLKQISNTNLQQVAYNWGSVSLIDWKDYNGDSIAGLLYRPEDFDSTKQYPLLVYFYERYTDNYHYYYRPKPTASIIYPSEYVSNGYVVLIPDIKYQTGKPAVSAYNAIMSGTDYLVRNFTFIDSTRMGLQGQSWGGYQTAQLITMTTRYRCAMAGAPVSNMFSAYGGIRWGSGMSRAFQYETGQSRIGATIWEAPELYIENSPIFHLPKVKTPLLIMHNDGDGAVPWYQGIELFTGLRRLQKPVWLLNYNGDAHNLRKDANKMDLSIRMRQFFDYYLLETEKPNWMQEGLPAINKGKENGY